MKREVSPGRSVLAEGGDLSTRRTTLTTERLLFQKNNPFQDGNAAGGSLELRPDLFCRTEPPAPMTLFQWQIQQEQKRVEGTPAELLSRQDADGDT